MKYEKNQKGITALICYNAEDPNDRAYGPKCAAEAVAKLNGLNNLNGMALPNNSKFYVKEALKKTDHEA